MTSWDNLCGHSIIDSISDGFSPLTPDNSLYAFVDSIILMGKLFFLSIFEIQTERDLQKIKQIEESRLIPIFSLDNSKL
jgi:hypothetical protein